VRRFAIIFALVMLATLVGGLVLNTFMMGGDSFVGLPLPILKWPRPLPPIPGQHSIHAGPDFSILGLGVDLAVWTAITLVGQKLMRSLRSRPRAAE
jgi:hypothetical protein